MLVMRIQASLSEIKSILSIFYVIYIAIFVLSLQTSIVVIVRIRKYETYAIFYG